MNRKSPSSYKRILSIALIFTILLSTLGLTSCTIEGLLEFVNIGNNGDSGNNGDGASKDKNDYVFVHPSYGSEYIHTKADMGADTKLSLGTVDVMTNTHLIFTANVESFKGIRLGQKSEDSTSSYIEIDTYFTQHYWYETEPERRSSDLHQLDIKNYIKVEIKVDSFRVATINVESAGQSFTFTTSDWYNSNGEIFVESLGSVMKEAQLAFTCDGYSSDVQFYGDSSLSLSSNGWLKYALDDEYTDALYDGFSGKVSHEAYVSLTENLKHSSPKTVVWMMGADDGSDADVNTPCSTWAETIDDLIALSEEYDFEIVFTTIPTVTAINHEGKNKWIRESGYRYIDIAAALGADGTGKWTKGYLNADGTRPSILGARTIYYKITQDLYGIESNLGTEYKQASGNMGKNTKLSVGIADVNTNKHLVFSANITSFSGLRLGHGHSSYTSDYIEIDDTYVIHYQRMSELKMVTKVKHKLDIKDYINVTIDTGIDNSATIRIESNGNARKIQLDVWYGCSGEIFAESLGSVLTDAQLGFTCDGYKSDIQFYGDSYIFVWSAGRWPYYAFKDGYTDALYDGFGGRGSGGAYKSLAENIKYSSPEIVVWMLGMNDGGDPDINTPCQTWATNRDKVIALSEECGFEIVFVTIPTIPTRSHEAKNKWIRESGYRYIDMAAALGADGTGAWHEGYLSSDGVHPTNSGGKAIYEKIVADLPEFSKARNEDGQ